MRLIFLGSPPFALPIFEALLTSDHEVALLVTPPDRPRGRGRVLSGSPLAEAAERAGVACLRPETTRAEAFPRELAAHEPELLVVASYGEILRQPVLELAPHGALNVHASLLPRWRGASPIQRAILAGDPETGVSIQRMVLALDAGDVLLSQATAIEPEETAGELLQRLADLGATALLRAIDMIASGSARYTPQDPAGVTLAPKLRKEDGRLDWSRTSDEILRRVRAMTPWPGARTSLVNEQGTRPIVVTRARAVDAQALARDGRPQPAGSLLDLEERLLVQSGDGVVELLEIKPAGKSAMSGHAFLRGARLDASAHLV